MADGIIPRPKVGDYIVAKPWWASDPSPVVCLIVKYWGDHINNIFECKDLVNGVSFSLNYLMQTYRFATDAEALAARLTQCR